MTKNMINADVVVAGAGGAGLAAAYAAAQKGLKVIVIEKLSQIGGNTRISSGFFAIDSKEQRAAGLHLSKTAAVKKLMNYNHFLANGPLIRHIVNSSAETLAWLEDMGMEIKLNPTEKTTQFAHRGDNYRGGSYHMYQHKDQGYHNIQKTLEKIGVNFFFGVTMKRLLINEQGKIIGISAINEKGDSITVSAPSAVITTGGFGANKEKVARVMKTPYLRTLGVPSMGEGLEAMEKVGAENIDGTALIHAAQLAKSKVSQKTSQQHLAGFSHTALTQMLLTPLLWVSLNGSRFTNEEVVYDTAEWANAGWSVGGKYYFIADQKTLKSYTNGSKLEVSQAGPGADTEPGDFIELAEEAVKAGTAFKGQTLSELAGNANMDLDIFKKTIAAYNRCIAAKSDNDFSKPAKSLIYDVSEGPFYAFTAQVAHLGTIGGVRVDENLRVLNQNMKPIPGLYTGGANAGGYYEGHSYPTYEGLASGFSWTSGRIAGNSAAKYVQRMALNKM